jgi:outer membrane protein
VRPDNSYTLNVSAFLPVWDWGERKSRMAATEVGIAQTRLRIEEIELGIVSTVRNEVLNVRDREGRTRAMLNNLDLARNVSATSFRQYEAGVITASDLLLSLRREVDTAENFVQAYVSWKRSLVSLRRQTYYDFEQGRPVLDWFRGEGWIAEDTFDRQHP